MDTDARSMTMTLDDGGGSAFPTAVADLAVTEPRTEAPAGGERRLLIALLEDGMRTYQRYAFSGTRRGRRLFQEVETWFNDPNFDAGIPFPYVCEVLGIEPDYVRGTLEKWRAAHFTGPSVSASQSRPYGSTARHSNPTPTVEKPRTLGFPRRRRSSALNITAFGWA